MKVYISGPITGVDDFEKNFQEAEDLLRKRGLEVVNPVKIGEALEKDGLKLEYEDYMRADIAELMKCDAIYMLDGSEDSEGACCEYCIAKSLNMFVLKLPKERN
jgi:nucleoside 2-deoxyribosyltransferase